MIKGKEPKPTKTKLHKGMLLFYCACVLVLIFAFGLMTFRMVLKSKLNAKLDEIRTAGYPATLAELNDYYPAVPDDENAAILYEKAFKLFHDIDDKIFEKDINGKLYLKVSNRGGSPKNNDSNRPKLFRELLIRVEFMPLLLEHQLSEESNNANRQFVNANRATIKILKKAVLRPECRFPINFSLFNLIRSARLLLISTVLAEKDDQPKQVIDNIMVLLKICHTMDNQSTYSSCIMKYALQRLTVATIEYTLSSVELDANTLQQISKSLGECLDEENKLLEQAFADTRIKTINFDDYMAKEPGLKYTYFILSLTGIITLNKLKILEIYEILFKLDKSDIKALRRYDDSFEKQFKEMSKFYSLSKILIRHSNSRIIYKKLKIEAQIKATIIGLAIERYRLQYNKLPKTLIQLVPEFIKKLPNDPFTGKPFSYAVGDIEIPIDEFDKNSYSGSYKSNKITDRYCDQVRCIKRPGWMVYSFGKDQDDDNGAPAQGGDNGDISFRCVRKKK